MAAAVYNDCLMAPAAKVVACAEKQAPSPSLAVACWHPLWAMGALVQRPSSRPVARLAAP
jgi:hypothetical protein